jgi:hypothetical protein
MMHRLKIVLLTLGCCLPPCAVQAKDLTTINHTQIVPLNKMVSNTTEKAVWGYSRDSLIELKKPERLYNTIEETEIEEPKISEARKIFYKRRVLEKKRAKLKKELGLHPPHVIITLYPRWFFVAGGIVRGIFYYYVHFYAALFLLWSGLKMAARMDFVFFPAVSWLDWAVRPLLLMSTKFLPFTGASGISAQIFLLIVSATGKFIRQFVWIIYDSEIDYLIREKRYENLGQPYLPTNTAFHPFDNEDKPITDINITGYEKIQLLQQEKVEKLNLTPPGWINGSRTISQPNYLKMEHVNNESEDFEVNSRLIEPSIRWLQDIKGNIGRIFHLNKTPEISEINNLYNGTLTRTGKDLWLYPDWYTDPNFAPGGKYSLVKSNGKPILKQAVKNLHSFDDFPFLNVYEQIPQLPRLRVLEYHEFVKYADNLGTRVIKYPEIQFWWKTPTPVGPLQWGGYVFNRACTYWPEIGSKWNTLSPGLTNWILRDETRIDDMLYGVTGN